MQYKQDEKAFNSITHELSRLRETETQGFIYRVLEPLRNVNSKDYEPEILAIGPYHRDKDKYKMMEEHKLRYLQSILNRRKDSVERYISAIGEWEQDARNCYAEPISLSQEEFIKVLVLDGCFIIELALKYEKLGCMYSNYDPILEISLISGSLKRDLMLFENQIPFFVLCKLFDLIEGPNQYYRLISLLLSFSEVPLLSSFRKNLFPKEEYEKLKIRIPFDVKHLLDLIYSWWTPESFDGAINLNEDYPIPVNIESTFIQHAAELKDANVKFRKRESCDSLYEVKFQNGTVLMPPLQITDDTECIFRNLIAYEQYLREDRNNYVTDYVNFIDLLINSSKDVDVLSKFGIIDNWLGDNEMIASMYNKLLKSVQCSSRHAYGKTFKDINTYYNKRWNRWMAVLNRDYFSSPWGCISLFAAFVLLLITIIQTVCSILQVV